MFFIPPSGHKLLCVAFSILVSGIWASPVPSSDGFNPSTTVTVAVTPSFVSNVFQNTYTSTIGSNGQPTPTPIVGGTGCWFCPLRNEKDINAAWALIGIDGPGTYQPIITEEHDDGFAENLPVITVSSDGEPSYELEPTPTIDEEESATNVKRAETPTVTEHRKSDNYKLFERMLPLFANYPNDAGFALSARSDAQKSVKIPFTDKSITFQWPAHYVVVTGFIAVRGERKEDCENDRIIEIIHYHWDTTMWDLGFRTTTGEIWYAQNDRDASRYDNDKVKWKWLGRISESARGNPDWIASKAQEVVDEMNGEKKGLKGGGYDKWFNNCRNFRDYLYKKIKY